MKADAKSSIIHKDCGRASRYFFSLCIMLLFFAGAADLRAAAPQRSGQPYAEATLCARADVIFCEDFNYPQNFQYYTQYGSTYASWSNPGMVGGTTSGQTWNQGRRINLASSYTTKPNGTLPSGSQPDYVWVANWDPTQGAQGDGSSWATLRAVGGNYVNGMAPAKDFYVRFQFYVTSNYAWPGDPKTDKYNFGAGNPVDNKILFVYPAGMDSPTDAAYDAGLFAAMAFDSTNNARFSDTLNVRVGNAGNGIGYETFPMCANCTYNPTHMEYAPYQSCVNNSSCTPYRNPHDTPRSGKIFRFDTGKWYTLEMRYKLSSTENAKDGTIEVWVDGTKIYSANDLATCGSGYPANYSGNDCTGLGQIDIVAYHNGIDQTVWNGQQIIDNLVISTSYIGPPSGGGGSGDTTAPAAPKNLRKR